MHSFWADEAYITGVAANWVRGVFTLQEALSAPGITYQRLHMLVVGVFFRLFGINEFVARLPSLIGYMAGVVVIYLLLRRLSTKYVAVLGGLLFALSHLNLAYATQAKPYVTIEALVLWILYLLSAKKVNHALVIVLSLIAALLHSIGVFVWILYFVYLLQTVQFQDIKKFTEKNRVLAVLAGTGFILVFIPILNSFIKTGSHFEHNHLYQSVKLFAYKYTVIAVCAALGFLLTFQKYKKLNVSVLAYALVVFCMASFEIYIFNIRYVLTLFGIMFVYFALFWSWVGERYGNSFKFRILNLILDGKAIIPLLIVLVIYNTGYKVARVPQAYYSPNIDKYGDVQIANYKDFYAKLKELFPDYKTLYVINDIVDVDYWYFGRHANAYFMKFTDKPYPHTVAKGAMVYGSLDDFKRLLKENPKGVLIMEDWQSFLPDDIKEYAKKNLRLEFRVESLREAPNDPWPLALYSWGMEK